MARRKRTPGKVDVRDALAKVGKSALPGLANPAGVALVRPSLAVVLDSALHVAQRELAFMAQDEGRMELADAKKLQALLQSMSTAQEMDIKANEQDLSGLTSEQVDERIEKALRELSETDTDAPKE